MTNLIDALHIPDTQAARDDRHLAIQRVGVPRRSAIRSSCGSKARSCDGPPTGRSTSPCRRAEGTHMSRFVAWLDAIDDPLERRRCGAKARAWLALLVPTPAASRPRSRSS
jgi:GTP cyclohydrolase I